MVAGYETTMCGWGGLCGSDWSVPSHAKIHWEQSND